MIPYVKDSRKKIVFLELASIAAFVTTPLLALCVKPGPGTTIMLFFVFFSSIISFYWLRRQ